MKLTLDSEDFYKWLVKHRFDVCLVVAIVWVGLVVLVLWPMGPAAKFEFVPTLKSAGKALAPLGIVLTLFLNFTTAVKGEVGSKPVDLSIGTTASIARAERSMAIIAKYDDDDYLAAKQWLKYCISAGKSPNEIHQTLEAIQKALGDSFTTQDPFIGSLDGLQSNVYVSVRRFLNYLDEIRIAVTQHESYVDKDMIFECLAVSVVSIYDALDVVIKEEQRTNINVAFKSKSWYLQDHLDLKEELQKFIIAKRG